MKIEPIFFSGSVVKIAKCILKQNREDTKVLNQNIKINIVSWNTLLQKILSEWNDHTFTMKEIFSTLRWYINF